MKRILFLISLSLPMLLAAQEDNWNVYLAQFENGPGSVLMNMDIKNRAPVADLPFVVITGVKISACDEYGLPKDEAFDMLYQISDSINMVIDRSTKKELVGSFTYQCYRLDYIYVNDTANLRNELSSAYSRLFPGFEFQTSISLDKEWKAYLEFLYPNEETMEYMANQAVLAKLIEAGDDLTQARKVDHWIYFSNKKDMNAFADYAKSKSFDITLAKKVDEGELPFQLVITRVDKVDLESISTITIQLRAEAKKYKGEYDGWETIVMN